MKSHDCSCLFQQLAQLPWNSVFEEQVKELNTHAFVAKCEALICHMCHEEMSTGDLKCYCGEIVDFSHFKPLNLPSNTGVEK